MPLEAAAATSEEFEELLLATVAALHPEAM
jgi:hypothetical protein